jgi:Ca2+-binding EF-hand superfamily protein
MNARLGSFILFVTLASTGILVEVKAAPELVGPPIPEANEVQDILFLGDNRPMRLRLHVRIDGKAFEAQWNAYMSRIFDFCDINSDGALTKEEAAKAPSASFLQSHLSGAIGFFGSDSTIPWTELDVNPTDGKVTLEKLKAYYRRVGFGPMQIQGAPGEGASQALTDALFNALDANHDGKLSMEEIENAAKALARFDFDEDEMISAEELVPTINGFGFGFVRRTQPTPASESLSFVVLTPGESPLKATAQLIRKYDKDKNGKLSRAESGFDEATFARLDTNKDGQLDSHELLKWFAEPADLKLLAQLGRIAKSEPSRLLKPIVDAGRTMGSTSNAPLEVFNPDKRTMALTESLHKRGNGNLLLAMDNALIELQREEGPGTRPNYEGVRQFYLQQFRSAAGDKKVLEKKDAMSNQFFQGLFSLIDRNNDDKITEDELKAFFDVHAKGASAFVTLSQGDHGRGLFELLDTDRDNRLSPRELKNAWKTLAPWDTDGDGCIARSEVPRQFQLTLSQGRPVVNARFAESANRGAPTVNKARSGPLWFRKMDRNADGLVSRNEFLGSDEDFDKIDTDHDGFIDEKEAEAADALLRKKAEDKGK